MRGAALAGSSESPTRARACDTVPAAFKDIIDEPTYAKSVKYTLAKNRLAQIERVTTRRCY